ncbi:MAG: zinc ribbon domain-containing protein [Pirellulales bacterium]
MATRISEQRQAAYYIGLGLQILGGLLFASTFVTSFMHFGDFNNFDGQVRSTGIRAMAGMGLLIVGGVVRAIGARGLAGSGVILDPQRARQDLEPFSRMAGGMAKDVLDEAEIKLGSQPTQVIMVRCRACQELNQETANFCQKCGNKL